MDLTLLDLLGYADKVTGSLLALFVLFHLASPTGWLTTRWHYDAATKRAEKAEQMLEQMTERTLRLASARHGLPDPGPVELPEGTAELHRGREGELAG